MSRIGLSDSEWRIMLLLWERPMTMPELCAALAPETRWSKHTIISFLNRMMAKGAIEAIEARPARVYRPLIDRASSMRQETRSFIRRVYHGDAGLLVASLLEDDALSDQEIAELERMLEKARQRADGDGRQAMTK